MKTVIDCAHLSDKKNAKTNSQMENLVRADKLDKQMVKKRCEKRKHIFA